MCIDVRTGVEGGVENLWITTGYRDILADNRTTVRHIWCGKKSVRRVVPGYRVGRVVFQADIR